MPKNAAFTIYQIICSILDTQQPQLIAIFINFIINSNITTLSTASATAQWHICSISHTYNTINICLLWKQVSQSSKGSENTKILMKKCQTFRGVKDKPNSICIHTQAYIYIVYICRMYVPSYNCPDSAYWLLAAYFIVIRLLELYTLASHLLQPAAVSRTLHTPTHSSTFYLCCCFLYVHPNFNNMLDNS